MGCSGKVIAGIIFAIVGIVAYILAFSVNEITRVDSAIGSLWCGWNGNGACLGFHCEDAFLLSQEDGTTYSENSWENLCDICETFNNDDCAACQNKLAGQIWIGGVAAGAACAAIGILCLIIPSARGCGGGILVTGAGLGLGAVISYIVMTMNDGACFDTENSEVEVAASTFFVGGGAIALLIGGIASCGATQYD